MTNPIWCPYENGIFGLRDGYTQRKECEDTQREDSHVPEVMYL